MKIVKIRYTGSDDSKDMVFIDNIKDSKLYYLFHFRKNKRLYDRVIKETRELIEHLNRGYKDNFIFSYEIIILDNRIFIVYLDFFNPSIYRLTKVCKLFKEYFTYISIDITSYLNREIRNLFIEYWSNYEFYVMFKFTEKGVFLDFRSIYRIVEKNGDLYIEKVKIKEHKNRIDNFEKELNRYLYKE